MILPEARSLKMVKSIKMMQLLMKITFLELKNNKMRLMTIFLQMMRQLKMKKKIFCMSLLKTRMMRLKKEKNLPTTKPKRMMKN